MFVPTSVRSLCLLALLGLGAGPAAAADHFPWNRYATKPAGWFSSDEAKRIAGNILSYQSPLGSWPKNIDTSAQRYDGDAKDLHGTFDNDATIGELRFLARIYDATHGEVYRTAFEKG